MPLKLQMEKVLTDFVKALRNSNVRVSPAETLDAMSVIDEIGYDDRELLKRSLSIVLPKTLLVLVKSFY